MKYLFNKLIVGRAEPRSEGGGLADVAQHSRDVQPLFLHRRLLRRTPVLHEEVSGWQYKQLNRFTVFS
jgi:hypothetical protein